MIKEIPKSKFVPLVVGATIFIVFSGAYFLKFSDGLELSSDQLIWGSFGSYLGGTIGAVFAFASFAVLLYTLFLQREELRLAISTLEKSAKSHEKQVANHEIQKFETTFYSLLELHNQTLKNLEKKIVENDAFLFFEDYSGLEHALGLDDNEHDRVFKKWRKSENIEAEFNDPDMLLNHLKGMISTEVELSQYFRVLYQILKFIAKNNILNINKKFEIDYLSNRKNLDEETEKMYASIVRTFVPVKFLPILALHCIRAEGEFHNLEKYRVLLERYDFLEHVRLSDFSDNLAVFLILDRYHNAFGDNQDIIDTIKKLLTKYGNHYDLTKGGYIHSYL